MRPLSMCLVTCLLATASPGAAGAWQTHLGGSFGEDAGVDLVFDGRNVVAIGDTGVSGDCAQLTVVKLARNGKRVWEHRLPACSNGEAVAVDAAGHVYAAGEVGRPDESTPGYFTVLKIASESGAASWTATLPERGVATAVAVDGDGNVVASGFVLRPEPTDSTITVALRLVFAAATGAEIGRTEGATADTPELQMPAPGILRRVASDGSVLWERPVAGFGHVRTLLRFLRTDAAGDVLVGGALGLDDEPFRTFVVVKLSGLDGTELWRHGFGAGAASALAVDRRNDVIVTGALEDPRTERQGFGAVKIDASGRVRWVRTLRAAAGGGRALALDPRGNVAVTGSAAPSEEASSTFVVARLNGRSGRETRPVRILPAP